MNMRSLTLSLVIAMLGSVAEAKPVRRTRDPAKVGAVARVKLGRELRGAQQVTARNVKLTIEEETARELQRVLRSTSLRNGVTGLFVADAKSGEPLFAVNATDPLNPASNVKLISTATALELLGPSFRYPTRVLGQAPVDGVVKGDIYLLGSHDPTLALADLDELAGAIKARGVTAIEGNVVVGTDPTRDGVYRAVIPIEILAGEPGQPAIANVPNGMDLVEIRMTAWTARAPMRPRLTYRTEITTTPAGQPRIVLTIGGSIGKDGRVEYPLWTKQRTATAAYALIAGLRTRQVSVTGELKVAQLGDFIGDAVGSGNLPVELARHESASVADIVSRVNKWSINWLSDRLVMTAAALSRRKPPSMALALEEMYAWLNRHPHVAKGQLLIDTGSGLSYRTEISPQQIVSIIRSAGGFTGGDRATADAWLKSLAVAGRDGTLGHRFRSSNLGGHVHGKTGTLKTVIALSGVLDIDPDRPLAFAIVTNTDSPLSKPLTRRAHEQLVNELARYLARTAPKPIEIPAPTPPPSPDLPDEPDAGDAALDTEAIEK
jgi:D-alanyl-D-alanine carboxypeptidase/D-alanyl-D-alanine-endopeptidase (penicillin-binding protein 4)